MAPQPRQWIDMFGVPLDKLPESIIDPNENDNYVPKENFMWEWTALPEKLPDDLFALRFTYQLLTKEEQPEQWVQMKNWEIESIEAQGDYVILDLKFNHDHVNVLLDYKKNPFSHTYAEMNVSDNAKHFFKDLFTKYALSPYWTARKLTALSLNISKYNSAVAEANKKKKSPRKPSAAGAGTSRGAGSTRGAPRAVPSGSRATEGPSRASTPTKRTRDEMEKSGVTEGAEVSSAPEMPTPLKKGELPDPIKATKIVREFNAYSQDCWPMGRYFTFNVDCYKCEKSPSEWVVRSHERTGVNWQLNNLMNSVKGDRQTVCVMPKGLTSRPTEADWPRIQNGEFYIIGGQHSLDASKILLKDDKFQHEQKASLRYWKAFLVWSDDWEKLRKISAYLNTPNKVRAFEASWAANIVAARDVWMAHGCPPKERENAKNMSPKWKVSLRTIVRKVWVSSFSNNPLSAQLTNDRS
jgi:hypothetical protein